MLSHIHFLGELLGSTTDTLTIIFIQIEHHILQDHFQLNFSVPKFPNHFNNNGSVITFSAYMVLAI